MSTELNNVIYFNEINTKNKMHLNGDKINWNNRWNNTNRN